MSYNERISGIHEFSVEKILEDCKLHVPLELKRMPYAHPELRNGIALLSSEEALDCYMAAYGEMHYAKCRAAFQNLPYPGKEKEDLSVELIDWGCGQGIASVYAVDYLKARGLSRWLRKITLIEPSNAALKRAIDNIKKDTDLRVRIVPINEFLPEAGNEKGIKGVY